MKKFTIITLCLILVASVCVIAVYLKNNTLDVSDFKNGKAVFKDGETDVCEVLTDEELNFIKGLFSGKVMYKDNLSCGFTENISVRFDNSQTFCFACDTCPVIYWKEKDKYFKLTETEQQTLYQVLEKHGFYFPCV